MATDDAPIWLSIGFVAGGALLTYGLKKWNIKRLIENTPKSKIRSIAMGLVEIEGTIERPREKYLISPFSEKECTYYRYEIEEYKSTGKSSSWVTIKDGEEGIPFYIKDETGKVLVDPAKASIHISQPYRKELSDFQKVPKNIRQFLEKQNISSTTLYIFNKKLRFSEYLLKPKDTLYVLGSAGDNPHVKEASGQHNTEDIMIQNTPGKPYLISNKSEKDFLSEIALKVYASVFGGAALMIFCLAILLIRFNIA